MVYSASQTVPKLDHPHRSVPVLALPRLPDLIQPLTNTPQRNKPNPNCRISPYQALTKRTLAKHTKTAPPYQSAPQPNTYYPNKTAMPLLARTHLTKPVRTLPRLSSTAQPDKTPTKQTPPRLPCHTSTQCTAPRHSAPQLPDGLFFGVGFYMVSAEVTVLLRPPFADAVDSATSVNHVHNLIQRVSTVQIESNG